MLRRERLSSRIRRAVALSRAKLLRVTCGQAQALLRWGLQKGMSVLPRSRHPPHIAQNLGARVVRFPPHPSTRTSSIWI